MSHERHSCGHNHAPNPYTDTTRAAQYHEVVIQLFRMTMLACRVNPQMAARFAALIGVGVAGFEDPVPTYRAMMWELADVIQIMSTGTTPEFESVGCRNPEHDHTPDEAVDGALASSALEAFFTAAAEGELQHAVNVVDALAADAGRHGTSPEVMAVSLFANTVVSTAYTLLQQTPDPLTFFG